MMLQVSLFQDIWLWLYFIHGLVLETSHGLGLGLGLGYGSRMLWSYGYGVYRVLVCFWDDVTSFIVPATD